MTGASKGVGKGIALDLARNGCDVAVNFHSDAPGAEATVAEIVAMGRTAFAVKGDVGVAADVDSMMAAVLARFGKLDILVNNAGVQTWKPLLDLEESEWDRTIQTNLKGCFLCTQRAARHMKDHGGGVILQNSSIAGTLAGHAMMTYRASKAALNQFSKSAAIDLGRYGIRVNCLVPGHIRTQLSSFQQGASDDKIAALEREVDAVYLSNQIIKRRGDPEDCAQAALFLASDRARQITGIIMPVEAGVTAGDPVNHLADIMDARGRVLGD